MIHTPKIKALVATLAKTEGFIAQPEIESILHFESEPFQSMATAAYDSIPGQAAIDAHLDLLRDARGDDAALTAWQLEDNRLYAIQHASPEYKQWMSIVQYANGFNQYRAELLVRLKRLVSEGILEVRCAEVTRHIVSSQRCCEWFYSSVAEHSLNARFPHEPHYTTNEYDRTFTVPVYRFNHGSWAYEDYLHTEWVKTGNQPTKEVK